MSRAATGSVWINEAGFAKPVREALQLLANHKIDSFENMETLAERLGFPIDYTDSLPLGASGFAHIDDDGLPFIAVNSMTDTVHQEATIAEEIGHHVLGHHRQVWRSDEELDAEAKLFASTLFMHNETKMSIGELDQHNPDMAPIMFAPLIYDYLPDVILCIQAYKSMCDRFAKACDGISRTLPRIAQFLELFREPEV